MEGGLPFCRVYMNRLLLSFQYLVSVDDAKLGSAAASSTLGSSKRLTAQGSGVGVALKVVVEGSVELSSEVVEDVEDEDEISC